MDDISYDPEKHHRRSIRLNGYDYSQAGAYFLTICTHNHEQLFGKIVKAEMRLSVYGRIVSTRWLNLPRYHAYIELSAFIVMPNHVHGIVMIKSDSAGLAKTQSVSDIVRSFKTFSSRRINEVRGTPGIPVWQRNYWEHIIRNEDSFSRIYDTTWRVSAQNPGFDHAGISISKTVSVDFPSMNRRLHSSSIERKTSLAILRHLCPKVAFPLANWNLSDFDSSTDDR